MSIVTRTNVNTELNKKSTGAFIDFRTVRNKGIHKDYNLILRKKEKILLNSFISFMVFLSILTLNFINLFTLNIKILPLRETSNADGLLILLLMYLYLVPTVILRLIAFIIAFIIKKIK